MGPCECEFWIRITPDTKQGFAKRVTYGLFTPSINFILLSLLSLPSSHTPPRNTPGVEQAGFLCKEGEPWGQCGASQQEGVRKDHTQDWAWVRCFGGTFKEARRCSGLDAIRDNPIIGHFKICYLEAGKTRRRL